MKSAQRVLVALLACFSIWTVYATSFSPSSWAAVSLSVWMAFVLLKGWRRMSAWDQRICFWGMFSLFSFLHFLISDPYFSGWGDVYFFCASEEDDASYCLPSTNRMSAFHWNLRGWRKAVALWNFFLSSAVGMQRLIIEIGLGGLLLGEDAIARESLLSVAWRLVPFWLNRWESSFGAECSSIVFELPHFATELLIVLPLTQILAGRLRIVGHPHMQVRGLEERARRDPHGEADVDHRLEHNMNEPREDEGEREREDNVLVPNVLNASWERDREQRLFFPRLRSNIRPMAMIALVSLLAGYNALVVPLLLEKQAISDPRANTISDFENELAVLVSAGRRADAMQHSMQRLHAYSDPMQSSPSLSSSLGGCMAEGNCTGLLHDRLARIVALYGADTMDRRMRTGDASKHGYAGGPSEWLVPAHWVVRLIEDMQDEKVLNDTKGTQADGMKSLGTTHEPRSESVDALQISDSSDLERSKRQGRSPKNFVAAFEKYLEKRFPSMRWVCRSQVMVAVANVANRFHRSVDAIVSVYQRTASQGSLLLKDHTRRSNSSPSNKDARGSLSGTKKHGKGKIRDIDIDKMVVLLLSENVLDDDTLQQGPDYKGLRTMQRRFRMALAAKNGDQDPLQVDEQEEEKTTSPSMEKREGKEILNPYRYTEHQNDTSDAMGPQKDVNESQHQSMVVNLAPLYQNLAKHADELRRMRDPEHRSLVPLVEAALTIMRLSCERWFALVGIYVAYLIYRDPPPHARTAIRAIARLSRTFHRVILLSFPGVCWIFGAGFVFSSFASVVFWTAPLLQIIERLRGVASEVEPESWHIASMAEIERNGGNCPVCWGHLLSVHRGGASEREPSAGRERRPGDGDAASPDKDGRRGNGGEEGDADLGGLDERTENEAVTRRRRSIDEGTEECVRDSASGRPHVMALPCGHAYHKHCLSQWLSSCHAQSRPSRCPMCLADVPLRIRWRVPLTGRGDVSGEVSDEEEDGNGGGMLVGERLEDRHDEGRNNEVQRQWHGRQRGIPGIDALVDDLRDEFRHRFELPMPHPVDEDDVAVPGQNGLDDDGSAPDSDRREEDAARGGPEKNGRDAPAAVASTNGDAGDVDRNDVGDARQQANRDGGPGSNGFEQEDEFSPPSRSEPTRQERAASRDNGGGALRRLLRRR